ncbi:MULTISPECIES: SRPBCC family protein [unclassified Arenibacter]|jgi:carbon monoxide dehydrogenase subunit G|uniref:SRPBCC family protein n=1 Tax=unclassified Arenibacter TaxID=2615047 RepID=UPI000E356EE4|nr:MULTISPECIES: SRPBCC family protein [unclassified Arenibacter]MCM4164130.1 orotate phosphoribosyltransferase [Arenibacter sp. A80]RFT55933.1 SRPBCC family protein [Arenibacter sp. P308M17]
MHLETPKKKVNKSSREVFDFLSDVKNFEILMPENISKFELINENRFLFALKGMPEIILQKKQQTPYSQLVLGAASDKLPFTLTVDIATINEHESEVTLSFEGEFNAMMAMMIKSPINNFIATLSENLSKI